MIDPGDYSFDLPERAIAQRPPERRDDARLLTLRRSDGAIGHRQVRDLPELLPPGALVVVNDTRVLPARLMGQRPTGGQVEVMLLKPRAEAADRWEAWVRPSARVRPGMMLSFPHGLRAVALAREADRWLVELRGPEPVAALIEKVGRLPLPPYIARDEEPEDRERYQTIFAAAPGAVAAPTAGLHFSAPLRAAVEAAGHRFVTLTLHVGAGTFAPLRAEQIEAGRLHAERYEIPAATWEAISEARAAGRPVVAVGTTVVRALETCARGEGAPALAGESDLFIQEGFPFQIVDAMITNFHLPRSSLLMLVSAFAGRAHILNAYAEAVRAGYRFYSYGDATLLF